MGLIYVAFYILQQQHSALLAAVTLFLLLCAMVLIVDGRAELVYLMSFSNFLF